MPELCASARNVSRVPNGKREAFCVSRVTLELTTTGYVKHRETKQLVVLMLIGQEELKAQRA
jgi:hypothetical protein